MILFLEDWKKYPFSIADTETKNKSFVRLASVYREMGVKNHMFLLALVNVDLQGVDPHSPNLTVEQQMTIALECKVNPWYFFREVARAPSKAGGQPSMFEASRGNIALFWLFFNHITLFLIMIRQSGKSFAMDTLGSLLMNILCTKTQINLLTKDDTLRRATITRLKDIDLELPKFLRRRTPLDANNTEQLTIRALGNSYEAHVPQASEKAAEKVGRGLTSPIFFIDEPPFQNNIAIALPAALAAGTAARDEAKKNNEPYGTIFTTTAGKRDDKDGKYVYGLVASAAEYTELFLDAENIEQLELLVKRRSRGGDTLMVNCTFNHKQLGKTDEWLKRVIKDNLSVGEAADRDFFNVWTTGTQTSPLPVQVLEKIRKSQTQELHLSIDSPYGYITKWYIPENEIEYRMSQGHYILGMDTSDASGGDDISLYILDIITGETVAAGNYNETNLITFCKWLCTWFQRFPNLTANIERRSSGAVIIDFLLYMLPSFGIDPFKRIFNTAVNNHLEDTERWKEINIPMGRRSSQVYEKYKKTFGFATSGTGMFSRTELYSNTLQLAASKIGDKLKDKTTIDQVAGLITLNGRIDHAPGEHDDMVIAWLLSFWLITLGKNLSFYGIDSKTILCEVNKPEIVDAASYFLNEEQQKIRFEIEENYEELSKERDNFIIQRLEFKLKALNRRLILQEGESFSVDGLINSLREKRKSTKFNLDHGRQNYHGMMGNNSVGVPSNMRNYI